LESSSPTSLSFVCWLCRGAIRDAQCINTYNAFMPFFADIEKSILVSTERIRSLLKKLPFNPAGFRERMEVAFTKVQDILRSTPCNASGRGLPYVVHGLPPVASREQHEGNTISPRSPPIDVWDTISRSLTQRTESNTRGNASTHPLIKVNERNVRMPCSKAEKDCFSVYMTAQRVDFLQRNWELGEDSDDDKKFAAFVDLTGDSDVIGSDDKDDDNIVEYIDLTRVDEEANVALLSVAARPNAATSTAGGNRPHQSTIKKGFAELRKKMLRKFTNCPPHCVFTETIQQGIIDAMPANLDALRKVNGVGAAIKKHYGDAILSIIQGAQPGRTHAVGSQVGGDRRGRHESPRGRTVNGRNSRLRWSKVETARLTAYMEKQSPDFLQETESPWIQVWNDNPLLRRFDNTRIKEKWTNVEKDRPDHELLKRKKRKKSA
jgi:hypothetical protein